MCTHNQCFEQKYGNIKKNSTEIFFLIFADLRISVYTAWVCFCNEDSRLLFNIRLVYMLL